MVGEVETDDQRLEQVAETDLEDLQKLAGTVPKREVAETDMDMEVFGLSVITDMGNEESIEEVNHAEVLKAAQKAEPQVRLLIRELIQTDTLE